ncbi:MAG: Vacuolar protein-sorting-associated protein 28 [Thelocarpon impressellum]|nr:MAG: Vacuolar protein-sorting-associated protein 28 [Thelocarpon impressellum]
MHNARQLPYAPTPYSYTPSSATINLNEEVKLTTSNAERDLYDSLAEIYSVIVTLDALEKAYIKDSVTEAEYTATCDRLLKQYKAILGDDAVSKAFKDLETFKQEWDMECPRATERLKIGLPATVEQPSHNPSTSVGAAGKDISTATENFINFLDALELGLLAKDSLHPLLADVIQSVNRVSDKDFEGRSKIVQWLITLNQMKASEEVSKDQVGELKFDIRQAYHGFKATLD